MRPIDADVLAKSLSDRHDRLGGTTNPVDHCIRDVLLSVIEDIEETSTLDYAPVVHGEWIEDDTQFTRQRKCSICGHCDNPKTAIRGHFCWYCGAKMDGGKSDV